MKKYLTLMVILYLACSLTGCFERIVPKVGAWYCEELDILLCFGEEAKSQYRGEVGYQIGGEYKDNVIYLTEYPSGKTVFACDCTYNDGNKMIVKEHGTGIEYIFIKK